MKNKKLLLLMSLLFFVGITFSQNTVTYSSLSKTIDLNSGVEATVDIAVNCYGNSSSPVILNALQSCGNNDGIFSTSYTNGNILSPGQNTIIRYKFKKTVTSNTQIIYKFSTNGSCFQSESQMIKITVNYKAGSTTNPPDAIPAELIYIGAWPTTKVTINEGQVAPKLTGTGAGSYTHQWYKTIDGVFKPITGATNYYYYPGTPIVTTKYFRQNISGSVIGTSNEITITVINNAPPILNNIITINGKTVTGTSPTGGLGTNSYNYSWVVTDEDGDSRELPYTSPTAMFSAPVFANYLKSPNTFKLERVVYSGSQRSGSNYVLIPHISPIQNNIISINGNQVTGTIPTGGIGEYNGDYTYLWSVFYEDGEAVRDLPFTSQNVMLSEPEFDIYLKSAYNFKLVRIVYSGNERLFSNYVDIPHISNMVLNKEYTTVSAVYPNPTSGAINFTTDFISNKEIEIIVYSEELGKTQSIFKGSATPNQIVQCNIPSNYPKGIYYYRIVSENKEIKTGKIIFQ